MGTRFLVHVYLLKVVIALSEDSFSQSTCLLVLLSISLPHHLDQFAFLVQIQTSEHVLNVFPGLISISFLSSFFHGLVEP